MKTIPTLLIASLAVAQPTFGHEKDFDQALREARLEGQISTAILFNRHLNPFEISVDVTQDTARLTGTVDEAIDRELAEKVALNAKGIARVDNQIRVDTDWKAKPDDNDRDFSEAVEDATVTAAVKSRLLWNEHTDALDINVDTNNGRVTLNGSASSAAERDLATRLAAFTDGVQSVDNRIVVSPGDAPTERTNSHDPISDSWISAKVKASLLMSKNVDGLDLTVETKNGRVYLGGAASSPAERDLAVEIARDIRGVKAVDAGAVAIGV